MFSPAESTNLLKIRVSSRFTFAVAVYEPRGNFRKCCLCLLPLKHPVGPSVEDTVSLAEGVGINAGEGLLEQKRVCVFCSLITGQLPRDCDYSFRIKFKVFSPIWSFTHKQTAHEILPHVAQIIQPMMACHTPNKRKLNFALRNHLTNRLCELLSRQPAE
jgi:hypothetical protein